MTQLENNVEILSSFEQKPGLKDIWNGLLAETAKPIIFQRYEWVAAWWESFGRPKLYIVLIKEDGDYIGIAPLMIDPNPVWLGKRLKFIAADDCDYFDFIIKKGREETFLRFFTQFLKTVDFLEVTLRYLRGDSNVLLLWNKLTFSGCRVKVKEVDKAPYIGLSEGVENVKKKMSINNRRCENRIKKDNDILIKRCDSSEELDTYLELFFNMHKERWQEKNENNIFANKKWHDFLSKASRIFLEERIIRLYCLVCNEKPIAFVFGLKNYDSFLWYLSAFDTRFARYSPGRLLIAHLLDELPGEGMVNFDFGRGGEGHKFRWTESYKRLFTISLYPEDNTKMAFAVGIRNNLDRLRSFLRL
ncbi:MAG: GNAT family N-acetyltransferase [Candidatus Omnitrophota bacterium]